MHLKLFSLLALLLAALAAPALAHPPAELADYVGARAGQAEGGLNALGYRNIKGSYWLNSAEGVCVHMPVSQGRFKSVDIVKPALCGVKLHTSHGAGAGCPADVSQADRYLYPDCDKPAAKAPAASAGGSDFSQVSDAAVAACMKSADAYQGVAAGTSSATAVSKSGGNWVMTMSSGGTYVSTCTVSNAGKVVSMSPGA